MGKFDTFNVKNIRNIYFFPQKTKILKAVFEISLTNATYNTISLNFNSLHYNIWKKWDGGGGGVHKDQPEYPKEIVLS